MDGQGDRSASRPPKEPVISQEEMLVAVSKAAEELAVDEPKKKASSGAKKKTIPDSKPMVKMSRGKVTIDREALKTQIKRIKVAKDEETGDRPSKVQKVEPKSAKAAKFPVFAKGSKAVPKGAKGAKGAAKPRGRPPGALNKKTLARLSTTQQEPQLVQAA